MTDSSFELARRPLCKESLITEFSRLGIKGTTITNVTILTNIKKEAVNANNSVFCLFFVEKRRTFAHEFTRIPSEGCQKG